MADILLAKLIGDNVLAARILAGWTQQQLSDATGIRKPHISRLEHGGRVPDVVTLKKIADALGVRVCKLIDVPAEKGKK